MLRRYLDEIEQHFVDVPRTFALKYIGRIDERALSRALEALCLNHPVLRGRIESDDGGCYLYVAHNHRVEFKSTVGGKDALWQFANGEWDNSRAVVELAHIQESETGYIALRITHAIVDGAAFIAYLKELCEHYTDILHNNNSRVERNAALPTPPSDLIRERWDGTPPMEATRAPQAPETTQAVSGDLQFSQEDTSKIVEFVRREGLSINTFVGGAITLSLRRLHHLDASPLSVKMLFPINLRRRLVPNVGPTETTNLIGAFSAFFEVSHASTVCSVAQDIRAQMRSSLSNREIIVSVGQLPSSRTERAFGGRHDLEIRLSGLGIFPNFSHPDELRFTDVLHPPPLKIRSGASGTYVVYTFQGRLKIECWLPGDGFDNTDAEVLTRYIDDEIRGAAV